MSVERDDNFFILELSDISRSYGYGEAKSYALQNFSLKVKRGEFIMIMGPSGCGKTTLLNIIGLLDKPTSGNYFLNGTRVQRLSSARQAHIRAKKIGFIFQNFNLIPNLPVIENVALPLVYCGYSKTHRLIASSDMLSRFHLEEREYYMPYQLSGGQQQRVAIARSLVTKPEIILADEPTGNLDSRSAHNVMEELRAIHQEGNTIIMVTHNPALTTYATRVIHMLDGQIDTDIKTVADHELPKAVGQSPDLDSTLSEDEINAKKEHLAALRSEAAAARTDENIEQVTSMESVNVASASRDEYPDGLGEIDDDLSGAPAPQTFNATITGQPSTDVLAENSLQDESTYNDFTNRGKDGRSYDEASQRSRRKFLPFLDKFSRNDDNYSSHDIKSRDSYREYRQDQDPYADHELKLRSADAANSELPEVKAPGSRLTEAERAAMLNREAISDYAKKDAEMDRPTALRNAAKKTAEPAAKAPDQKPGQEQRPKTAPKKQSAVKTLADELPKSRRRKADPDRALPTVGSATFDKSVRTSEKEAAAEKALIKKRSEAVRRKQLEEAYRPPVTMEIKSRKGKR